MSLELQRGAHGLDVRSNTIKYIARINDIDTAVCVCFQGAGSPEALEVSKTHP